MWWASGRPRIPTEDRALFDDGPLASNQVVRASMVALGRGWMAFAHGCVDLAIADGPLIRLDGLGA